MTTFNLEDMPDSEVLTPGEAYSPTEKLAELEAANPGISEEGPAPINPLDPAMNDINKVMAKLNDDLTIYMEKLENYSGSKKQLQRVLGNLAIAHVTKDDVRFSYPEEYELFQLFENIMSSKFVLFLLGLESQKKVEILSPIFEAPKAEETASAEAPANSLEGETNE